VGSAHADFVPLAVALDRQGLLDPSAEPARERFASLHIDYAVVRVDGRDRD
jgi:hypothetical protein